MTDFAGIVELRSTFLHVPTRSKQYTVDTEMFEKAALCFLEYLCMRDDSDWKILSVPDNNLNGSSESKGNISSGQSIEVSSCLVLWEAEL